MENVWQESVIALVDQLDVAVAFVMGVRPGAKPATITATAGRVLGKCGPESIL